jgi:hypothetical protein
MSSIVASKSALDRVTFGPSQTDPAVMHRSMACADFSGKGLALSEFILLSMFLPKLTSVTKLNVSGNELIAEAARNLAAALQTNT